MVHAKQGGAPKPGFRAQIAFLQGKIFRRRSVRGGLVRCAMLVGVLALGSLIARPAAATLTEFASRASFENALLGGGIPGTRVIRQGWDNLDDDTILTTFQGVTYRTFESNDEVGAARVSNDFFDLTPPNSLTSELFPFFSFEEAISFEFDFEVFTWGISINTFAPVSGDFIAVATIDGIDYIIESVFDPFPPNADFPPSLLPGWTPTGQFVGFASDLPITAVTILPNLSDIWVPNDCAEGQAFSVNGTCETFLSFTLDSMNYIKAVPAPGAAGLMALALVGLGWVRRRG